MPGQIDIIESGFPCPPLSIVVCDDDPTAASIVADLLEILGHQVRSFTAPREAIAAVAACPPDLAVLDIRMPDMDGFQCCAEMQKVAPRTVFVACSGWSEVQVKRRALASGFSYHLVKPVGLEDLSSVVRAIADGRGDSSESP